MRILTGSSLPGLSVLAIPGIGRVLPKISAPEVFSSIIHSEEMGGKKNRDSQ
jgi:hypothetical protein